ncbi:MAG: toprim domain-containing protein [Terricaulis sp.]
MAAPSRGRAMIDLAALAKRAGGSFNGKDALIPGPGHRACDRSLSLTIGRKGQLIAHSFAGDEMAAIAVYLKSLGVEISAARQSAESLRASERAGAAKASAGAHLAARLWRESILITDTLAARYLENRAVATPWPPALRFHPACPDGPFRRPALIAARTLLDRPDQVGSVQRTFLRRDGAGKAETANAKKMLGACKGGGVVLGEIGGVLLVAEGVETALSAAALFAMPAVATLGAAHTRKLIVPESVREIVIAADNDETGRAAAEALAARLRKEGRSVRVESPPPALKDFNDAATAKERDVGAPRPFRGGGPPHGI